VKLHFNMVIGPRRRLMGQVEGTTSEMCHSSMLGYTDPFGERKVRIPLTSMLRINNRPKETFQIHELAQHGPSLPSPSKLW
jgi:hypothetical protein